MGFQQYGLHLIKQNSALKSNLRRYPRFGGSTDNYPTRLDEKLGLSSQRLSEIDRQKRKRIILSFLSVVVVLTLLIYGLGPVMENSVCKFFGDNRSVLLDRIMLSNERDYVSDLNRACLLYTSPSPRDATLSRMPSSA